MFRKPIRASRCWGSSARFAQRPPCRPAPGRAPQAQGVTDDEIQVVALVADLDGLRSKGLIAQPKLTTGNLLKRWQAYADAYGPINGRKIVDQGRRVGPDRQHDLRQGLHRGDPGQQAVRRRERQRVPPELDRLSSPSTTRRR